MVKDLLEECRQISEFLPGDEVLEVVVLPAAVIGILGSTNPRWWSPLFQLDLDLDSQFIYLSLFVLLTSG